MCRSFKVVTCIKPKGGFKEEKLKKLLKHTGAAIHKKQVTKEKFSVFFKLEYDVIVLMKPKYWPKSNCWQFEETSYVAY
jgi:hypothetical protein